jgi:mycofactocin precursor
MADQDAKLADATTKTDVDSQIEETLIEEVSIDGMCGVY